MKNMILAFIVVFSGSYLTFLLAKYSGIFATDYALIGLVGPVIVAIELTRRMLLWANKQKIYTAIKEILCEANEARKKEGSKR